MSVNNYFLAGRVAMVTGGASGMGRAMALAFGRAGANVVIGSLLGDKTHGRRVGEIVHLPGAEELNNTKLELEAYGIRCLAMALDVTSDNSTQEFFDKSIQTFGKIDILANAAGITAEQSVCGHTYELWDKVIDVNLNGTFRMIRLCLPSMIEQRWGRIINIASTAASVGAVNSAAYCASKAGVVGMTRCVALEGAEYGITCNAISPTWVETPFGKDWMTQIAEEQEGKSGQEYIAESKAQNPQKRLIQPEEVGALAQFLCRDDAVGITMQDLTISGGSLW
jgi:NAD(P)-dependent dehydrogenase (short-subunit alcohol dehydrogenase family)